MDLKNRVMNAPERAEYAIALKVLEPILKNLPPTVIAIDGKPGVGKTTLARFLAWRFNISLLETYLFMHKKLGRYSYNNEAVKVVIDSRRQSKLPVIVDGVVALRLLNDLDISPDFHIHVTCKEATSSVLDEYFSYTANFQPAMNADLVLELPVIER